MKELTEKELRGIATLKRLRRSTLNRGEPFIIFDTSLPPDHYYLEFPNGNIEMITMSNYSAKYQVREVLGMSQSDLLRKKFDFDSI